MSQTDHYKDLGHCILHYNFSNNYVKNLLAMWETWVQSLGWEDPLEKGTANHASILAWRNPWTEEPGGLPSKGMQRVGHNLVINTHNLSRKWKF